MLVLNVPEKHKVYLQVPAANKPTSIEVEVVRIGDRSARIGFEAPRSVQIVRDNAIDKGPSVVSEVTEPATAYGIIADVRARVLAAEPKISEASLLNQMIGMLAQQVAEVPFPKQGTRP